MSPKNNLVGQDEKRKIHPFLSSKRVSIGQTALGLLGSIKGGCANSVRCDQAGILFFIALLLLALSCPAAGNATGWSSTGSLAMPWACHTAILLGNGKVLVAGGTNDGFSFLANAELYNPSSEIWSPTGALSVGRYGHTATLLPNGKVLVAGGLTPGFNTASLASAEIYDPATGTWSSTGSLVTGRGYHTATLLSNGKVLVAGGIKDKTSSRWVASAEIYDPATGIWSPTGALSVGRYGHTATLLPNGKVLVVAGLGSSSRLASNELYNPDTGTWSSTSGLTTARYYHTATLLPNGQVLIAGGEGGSTYSASVELYDSVTGTWPTGPMGTGRKYHTATLLPNGKVLVAGGAGLTGNYSNIALASAEIYDPDTWTWSATNSLATARGDHTATLLGNGLVLAAGGAGINPSPPVNGTDKSPLASCELYQSLNNSKKPVLAPMELLLLGN